MTSGTAERLGARVDAVTSACAVLAATSTVASLLVVFDLRIGPVVLVISRRYGRGVHLGDLLIGVPFGVVAVAAALVAVLGATAASRRTTPARRP
jgi:hypothetical protein